MIDVAVVGSLHLDIMVAAPRLPGRDETLIGSAWHYKCGGKGGNQAVAAGPCPPTIPKHAGCGSPSAARAARAEVICAASSA